MTKSRADQAVSVFQSGFNCSQSVFTPFSEGLDRDTALKVSCGFGGGMGHTGCTCGAVSGAAMAIGLRFGKVKVEDNAAKEKTYALVEEFSRNFKERYGSLDCTELIGCDLATPQGLTKARAENRFRTRCDGFVRDAALMLEDILRSS